MQKISIRAAAVSLAAMLILTGCGSNTATTGASPVVTDSSSETAQVASSGEMAAPEELNTDGLTPVTVDQLKDGEYEIEVDSSSSMFKITACTLTVDDGQMTARMTMGGTGYLRVYMGTGGRRGGERLYSLRGKRRRHPFVYRAGEGPEPGDRLRGLQQKQGKVV